MQAQFSLRRKSKLSSDFKILVAQYVLETLKSTMWGRYVICYPWFSDEETASQRVKWLPQHVCLAGADTDWKDWPANSRTFLSPQGLVTCPQINKWAKNKSHPKAKIAFLFLVSSSWERKTRIEDFISKAKISCRLLKLQNYTQLHKVSHGSEVPCA